MRPRLSRNGVLGGVANRVRTGDPQNHNLML